MGKTKRAAEAAESDEKAFDWGIDIPAKKRKRDDDAAAEPDAANGEVKKSKKDKKDKKGKKDKFKQESRREKKDKRKDLQDLPEEDVPMEDEAPVEEKTEPEVKKEKKSKKDKKDKKAEKEAKEVNGDEDESKVEKKEKKKEKKAKKEKKDKPAAEPTTNGTGASVSTPDTSNPNAINLSPSDAQKQDRHIVFVGNLPFTATAASITAHFASLEPIAVRCMKNKDDDKPCKGFAFVEFGKVWHMRTCLDKFHHSTFEDGVSAGRKINIELTAGGGGKTKQRQEKIRAKNEKLDENRAKRIENEKKPKKDAAAGGEDSQASNAGIHPSRLARLPGLGQ